MPVRFNAHANHLDVYRVSHGGYGFQYALGIATLASVLYEVSV